MGDPALESNPEAKAEAAVAPETEQSRFIPSCTGPDPNVNYPIHVVYCGECSMPVELCGYSPDPTRCRQWLEKELPDLAAQMAIDTSAPGAKGRQTRGGKGMVRSGQDGSKAPAVLEIARCPRGKKHDSVVLGFPLFGIAVKDVSRQFAQRFSCGVSVQSVPPALGAKYTGSDMLLIQADVVDKLPQFISEQWSNIPRSAIQDIGVVKR